MTTINKITELLNVPRNSFRSFERTDSTNLCAWVDFIGIYNGVTVGITIKQEYPKTAELVTMYNAVTNDFETEFKGVHCIIYPDNINEQVKQLQNKVIDKIYNNYRLTWLVERGLDVSEALTFLNLLGKITLTETDIEGFYAAMDSEIPFEGGMGFSEGIIGAINTLK